MKIRTVSVALRLVASAFAMLARLPVTGATDAGAAEIPASAAVQSLSIPPILADDVALIYEFPSRALLEDTQAFALGITSDWPTGSGGNASLGLLRSGSRSAAYLINQPLSYPPYDNPASPMFQAGFGHRSGPLRLGACVRHLKQETNSAASGGGRTYRVDRNGSSETENLELGLGLGIGPRDGASIDLSLDMADRRRFAETHETRVEEATPYQPYSVSDSRYRLDVDGTMEPELAFRVSLGGEGNSRFILAGRWTQAFPEVTFFRLDSVDTLETRTKAFSRRWLVAAAGGRTHGERETMLFASFERDDAPPVASADVRYTSSFNVRTSIIKVFTAGLSHRRPIRPHVTLLLGLAGQIQATDTRTENKATESETPDFETERITEDAKRFSWGLSYTRDRFQITGAASSTIRLDVPFVAMDARFFF